VLLAQKKEMSIAATRPSPSSLAWLVAASLLVAPGAFAQDSVMLENQVDPLVPGSQVIMPVYVRDVSATLLGVDAGPNFGIQSLAFTFEYSPASAIAAIDVKRAGITATLSPLFETEVFAGNRHSWIAAFDESASPLPFTLNAAAPGDVVAEIRITLAAGVAPDTLIRVDIVAPTALGNQTAGFVETAANGFLRLSGGTVISEASHIFSDGFESGSVSAWSEIIGGDP